MKRLLLIILFLLIPACLFAAENIQIARMSLPIIGGQVASAPAADYTDCSQINANGNTNSFAWFGDHTSGTTYGCKDSSTSINATSTEGTRNNTTPSSNYSQGVNCKITASSTFSWGVSSEDVISATEGLIQIDVYMESATGNNTIFFAGPNYDNQIALRVDSGGVVTGIFYSGGSYMTKTSTATVLDDTWTTIYMRWKNTGAGSHCDVKVGSNAWETATDTLSAWSGTLSLITINNSSYWTDNFYVDNMFISKSSGL